MNDFFGMVVEHFFGFRCECDELKFYFREDLLEFKTFFPLFSLL